MKYVNCSFLGILMSCKNLIILFLMNRKAVIILTLVFLFWTGCIYQIKASEVPANVKGFFKTHCISCHDDNTASAKLSLESLSADFSKSTWVRIHDRLKNGEMPPATEPRPKTMETESVLRWLSDELTSSANSKQQTDGRVLLRRMNRREYETTMHDLLGIALPLQEMLPEDNPQHGFDTVSNGLETSATHLLRYQQAADAAISEALPAWPVSNSTVRLSGRQWLESRPPPNRAGTEPFVRFEGDTLILCAQLYKHGSIHTPHTPIAGRYRFKASVRALNNQGKPIPVLIGRISSDRFAHEKLQHILDIQDAADGKNRIIEIETILPKGEQVYLEGIGLTFFHELEKQRNKKPVDDQYPGPGLAVEWIELTGPLDAGLGYKRMFGNLEAVPSRYVEDTIAGKKVNDNWRKWPVPGEFSKYPLTAISHNPIPDAEKLLKNFMERAFRRPPGPDQVAHFLNIVRNQLQQGDPFDEAMRVAYKGILCSPYFLNYVERPGILDDHALAARLARFLWNSMPDDELSSLAMQGELHKPEILRAQTERMLADKKATRFARSFSDQWLDLGKFMDMKPDAIYVEYDDMLAWSMPLETRRFFDEVLAKDLPTSAFFQSDWTFLNSRLARHYGSPEIEGMELRRVNLDKGSHRGGVITHASILKLTTNASYTSPIKRGAWVLERLLGKPPSPPPPDVKAVEPDIRGATTIREQLDKHKNVTSCSSCHVHIDPPGFALENFDVLGGWRDRYRVKQGGNGVDFVSLPSNPKQKVWLAKQVQANGVTASGQSFRNIDDYKIILLADKDQFSRNLAEKLIVYGTGAALDFADRETLRKIVSTVSSKNHGFRSLVHAVIQSPVFLVK